MVSSLSPVMAIIYAEYLKGIILGIAPLKPIVWLRYVDGSFIFWYQQGTRQILLGHVIITTKMRTIVKIV